MKTLNLTEQKMQSSLAIIGDGKDSSLNFSIIKNLIEAKDFLIIKEILKKCSFKVKPLDHISNRLADYGDFELYKLFYDLNKEELIDFHAEYRVCHGNYVDSFNAFFIPSLNNNPEFIESLLNETELNPSCYGNEALFYALEKDYWEVAFLLLNNPSVRNTLNFKEDFNNHRISNESKEKVKQFVLINNF